MDIFREDVLDQQVREFHALLWRGANHPPGTYEITVAQVVATGDWFVDPWTAEYLVVRDTAGVLWTMRECPNLPDGIVSRHDVRPGMRFSITVGVSQERVVLSKQLVG